MLKARLDIAVNLEAMVDVLSRLSAKVGLGYMYGAVYFPLGGTLVSNCGKHVMNFSRDSIAYDSKGTRVGISVPRWEEVV